MFIGEDNIYCNHECDEEQISLTAIDFEFNKA